MIQTTVTLECDRREHAECWSLDPYRVPIAGALAAIVRDQGRALGWHRPDNREDVCPECWRRRVRYRSGRPITGD